jgi:putative heme iron utilization protein
VFAKFRTDMTIDDRDKPSNELARRLIRTARTATLATIDGETGGAPYASIVLCACGYDAAPLVLLSDLARHTRNFKADPRVSMLYARPGTEAINLSRATVIGRMEPCEDERLHDRFLRQHARGSVHMAFADFHLYRLQAESVHFIGGFGRIETVSADEVVLDGSAFIKLADAEADIVEHMNADHADAIRNYANNLADRPGIDWTMTAIDPEGCDLTRNDTFTRVSFVNLVTDAVSARAELVRLAEAARTPHLT